MGPDAQDLRTAGEIPLRRLKLAECAIAAVRADFGNPDWDAATARVLIVRLSPFPDVNRSTPHLVLFSECRAALPAAYLDLAFLPERPDRETLSAGSLPWFVGVHSGRGVRDFDLVLVSNAFTLELVNLPWLFATAGLPLFASERARLGAARPLAILGGSNASAAGALVRPDGDAMVDGLFFGEGEGAIGELARILSDRAAPPDARLARAASVPGFWPAGSPAGVERRVTRPVPPPVAPLHPVLNSDEASTARLQITHGCPAFCSFCLQGWDRKPYREVPLRTLLDAARELKRATGAETLELYSLNVNMHSGIFSLLLELSRLFGQPTLIRPRADSRPPTPMLLQAEVAAGKRSFTVGVEGISARLRAYYRKGVSGDDLNRALRLLLRAGLRELKLFHILSGFEEEADFAELEAFAGRLRHDAATAAPGLRVVFSFGCLVRLPFTPLQFERLLLDEAAWRGVIRSARGAVERHGFEFRLAQRFDEYAAEQVLALGGGALADWLAAAPDRGFLFDGTLTPGAWEHLRAFAADRGITGPAFLAEKPPAYRPPLAFVGSGVTHERLHAEFLAARNAEDVDPCLGGRCSACGACVDAGERAFHREHAIHLPAGPDFAAEIAKLLRSKSAQTPVYAVAMLPPELSGATPEYLGGWFLRRLFRADPAAADSIWSAKEALFADGELSGMLPVFSGRTVFAVRGSDAGATGAALARAGFEAVAAPPEPARVRVALEVPHEVCADAIRSFSRWLIAQHVGHTLARRPDGWGFEIAPKAAKKHVLLAGSAQEGVASARFDLVLGRKAGLGDWLGSLGVPWYRQAVRIRVVGWEPDVAKEEGPRR